MPDDQFTWSPQPRPNPSGSPQQPRPSALPVVLAAAILIGLALLCAGGGYWLYQSWYSTSPQAAQPRAVTPRGDLMNIEKTFIQIYQQSKPSVVHITNLARVRSGSFDLRVQEVPQGTGSGFIWDEDGHIVTNYHVIQGADAAQVTLADNSSYQASLVGAAPDQDLAVLRIHAPKSKLRPIPVGTSHDLRVGQMVFAIGNPFGLDQTLTTGVVSAVGREIESVSHRKIKNVIQTDAAINPGNSGGPLLDSAARLIGVNAAIFSPSGASAGIGFAIPVDEVNRIVPRLIRDGKISRPGLGVQLAPEQWTEQFKLPGVLILRVFPDSPAEKAGLRGTSRSANGQIILGDVIVEVDGKKIKTTNDLLDALDKHKAGDTVNVAVIRDGQRKEVQVTLAELD
jgi:S1-C subfamily serine protease